LWRGRSLVRQAERFGVTILGNRIRTITYPSALNYDDPIAEGLTVVSGVLDRVASRLGT
jgi:hypothetical protein